MISDALKEFAARRPFVPFTIHMADGRAFEIRHPEAVIVAPGGSTAVAYIDDDAIRIIQLVMATAVENAAGERAAGNGR